MQIALEEVCCLQMSSAPFQKAIRGGGQNRQIAMRVKTLQIIWNGKEPVFSVDFHSSGLLASAGSDKEIKVRLGTA